MEFRLKLTEVPNVPEVPPVSVTWSTYVVGFAILITYAIIGSVSPEVGAKALTVGV